MRIAVLGATGRTGRRVVEQALDRGHHVTALARRPDAIAARGAHLVTAPADALKPTGLVEGFADAEAVISTLGAGTSRAPTVLYSQGIENVLRAMDTAGAQRLVVISAAPVGPRAQQPFLERRIAMPILDRLFGATYEDMRRMEGVLRDSTVAWTSLRPPRLIDKPPRGHYRIATGRPLANARSLTYGDLATALLDAVQHDQLERQAAFVAN